ncbi:hypothetical protein V1478_015435 [Vespula squamosa]|uniref:Uncharacterized protein n=1 Tax=Vespula squamosa TaxID=30214 RepID=A0ABD2A5G1_VESSQ
MGQIGNDIISNFRRNFTKRTFENKVHVDLTRLSRCIIF